MKPAFAFDNPLNEDFHVNINPVQATRCLQHIGGRHPAFGIDQFNAGTGHRPSLYGKAQTAKLADTAALESIARVNSGRCADAPGLIQAFAEENAATNGFLHDDTQSIGTRCVTVATQNGLRTPVADAEGLAVEAIATETVPASLLFRAGNILGLADNNLTLQATAVAEREGGAPTTTFSIGAELLRLDNSKLVGGVLKAVGMNVNNLTLLNSNGLANASITPAGLLKTLGIEASIYELKALSPQGLVDLVNAEVGLLGINELTELSVSVISDSVLKAELEAFKQAILSNLVLKDAELALFGTEDNPGLLTLSSAPGGTLGPALDADINLGELLGTGILIGTGERGLEIPELNLLGLTQAQLGIVEPPTIAVGPVGTQAYNAQIRLYLDIDTNNLPAGILNWLTDSILGLRVHLPVAIDITTAQAGLYRRSVTPAHQPPPLKLTLRYLIPA
ncbi:hypothetical protein MBH78_11535 [Oceanimonas sp. NS1]|nr:hypothetical protein [Oceanimonas sp. NS1]